MKRLGKAVILTFAEYESLMCRTEDAEAHAADFAEELSRVRADSVLAEAHRRAERKAAFEAGKFHSAGGYAHALKGVRLKLQGTTAVMMRFMDLAAKWRPLVEALETYPNQFVEIGFDAGLHFPVKRFNKDGTEYLAMVPYQEGQYPDHSHDLMRKFGDMSDPAAPADFEAVGAQVRQERNDLESQVTTLDRLLSELPDSSVIDRMSLESRKKEAQDELAGKVTG
jgi:hypothetical protein